MFNVFKKKTSKCCNTTIPLKRASWKFNAHQKWLRKQFLPSEKKRDGQFLPSILTANKKQFESLKKTVLSTCFLENFTARYFFQNKKMKLRAKNISLKKGRSLRPLHTILIIHSLAVNTLQVVNERSQSDVLPHTTCCVKALTVDADQYQARLVIQSLPVKPSSSRQQSKQRPAMSRLSLLMETNTRHPW